MSLKDIAAARQISEALEGKIFPTTSEEVEEFYNHNHDKDGKFAPGPGGKGDNGQGGKEGPISGSFPGIPDHVSKLGTRPVKDIAPTPIDINGKKFTPKRTYEVTAKDGTKIHLNDFSNGFMTGRDKRRINALADAYDQEPTKGPPPSALVFNSIQGYKFQRAAGLTKAAASGVVYDLGFHLRGVNSLFLSNSKAVRALDVVSIGTSVIYNPVGAVVKAGNRILPRLTKFKMPVINKVTPSRYTVTHEYGHHIEEERGNLGVSNALSSNHTVFHALSRYGRKNPREAYAEAYTEWHLTEGTTKNVAARAYAKAAKWNTYKSKAQVTADTDGMEEFAKSDSPIDNTDYERTDVEKEFLDTITNGTPIIIETFDPSTYYSQNQLPLTYTSNDKQIADDAVGSLSNKEEV